MGRMFEALQKADAIFDPPALVDPLPEDEAPEPQAVADAPEPDADDYDDAAGVSFIEVGPALSMEASEDVLATAPKPTPRRAPVVADEPPRSAPIEDDRPPVAPLLARPALDQDIAFRLPPAPPVRDPLPSRPRLPMELVAFHCPEARASTGYQNLLRTLLAPLDAEHPAALFFTAARYGAGTTTVLLNLALTAARHDRRRVVVVDANFRRPGLAAKLHLDDAAGLRDVLAGGVALDDALRETEAINLLALTTGSLRPNAGLRVVAGTMRSVLRELRRRFHLILVDGPRWDGRPEVVAAGVACDAVYVVTPEAEAESPQVDQLLQVIPEQGGRLGGCVLSDVLG